MSRYCFPTAAAICALASALVSNAATAKVTYDDHVRPVFENKCFSCHNPDKAKGGLDLTTYGAVMTGGSSGEIVSAGDPSGSHLYKVVTHAAEPFMPPEGDKIPADQAKVISDWISGGLLENSGSKAKKPKPSMNIALAAPSAGKPEGPPPMPEHLSLEPVVATERAFAPADIASSPWAPLVAITAPKQVLLYDTSTMRISGVLPFPEGFPENLAFSRSGQILVAGGGRGGKLGRAVGWNVKTGERVFEIGNEFDTVLAADLSADHSLVALGGPSRKVRVFAVADGEQTYEIKKHTDWVTALSFSPDGVLLATGDRNGNLFVWEAGTGNPFYTLKGHSKAITAVSWRADSNVLASASEDGTARLWEMNEGKQIKSWTAHSGGALDIAYSTDGRVVTCGRDRHAKVWDGDGNQKAATNGFSEFPVAACLTHDGNGFVVGDWTGAVKVFESADAKPRSSLAANPPTISARLSQAETRLAEKQQAVTVATARLAKLAEETAAAQRRLEAANAALGLAVKHRQDLANTLGGAKSESAKMDGERQAADADVASVAAKISELGDAIKAASSDAGKLQHLRGELNQAEAELRNKQSTVAAKASAAAAAAQAVATAEKGLAEADAKVAAAKQAKEVAEADLAARQSSQEEAAQSVAAAESEFGAAKRERQLWQAEELNRLRHIEAASRVELVVSLDEAKLKLAEAQSAFDAAGAAANDAAQGVGAAQAEAEAAKSALEKARAQLPDLEWELRLANVLVSQQLETEKAIRSHLGDTPDSVRGKVETALETARQDRATAEAEQARITDLIENSVATASKELELATAELEAKRSLLGEKVETKAELQAALQAAQAGVENAGRQLAQHDKKIAEMRAQYLAALPK